MSARSKCWNTCAVMLRKKNGGNTVPFEAYGADCKLLLAICAVLYYNGICSPDRAESVLFGMQRAGPVRWSPVNRVRWGTKQH